MSSVSAESSLSHCGKEVNHQVDFQESLPAVFPILSLPFNAQKTQLPAASLLGLRCEVSCPGIVFSLLH